MTTTDMHMFETATKTKLRFDTERGLVSTEDLWDMRLTGKEPLGFHLNGIARGLSKVIREAGEEDFVGQRTDTDIGLRLRLDIVKRVIEVRLHERDLRQKACEQAALRDKARGVLAKRAIDKLGELTDEELTKLAK